MALGIIKPGQGYWMRVMTACLVGIAALTGAGWLADQAGVVISNMEVHSYSMQVDSAEGAAPAAGAKVSLMGRPDSSKPEQIIGTATLTFYRAEDRLAQITDIVMVEKHELSSTMHVVIGDATAPAWRLSVKKPAPIPPVERLYVQGGIISVVIIAGALLAFWLAGIRHSTVDFLIATDYEMKKVNWSTPKEIMGSTTVVIGGFVFIAVSLFLFDFMLQWIFTSIDVIQKPGSN